MVRLKKPGLDASNPGFLVAAPQRPGFLFIGVLTAAAIVSAQRVPVPTPIDGGRYEASGVATVAGTSSVLFVDNTRPREVFWMDLDASGKQAGRAVPVPLGVDVPDPEDVATDGQHFFAVSSQSQGGGRRGAGLVRFRFDSRTRRAEQVEVIADLPSLLGAALPDLQRGGRRGGQSLNIEGLVWDAARSRLLLGLRSPLSGQAALIVPLKVKDARAAFTAANLELAPGGAIRLALGGLAIRGLGYDPASKHVLVLAGASTYADAQTFRLVEWDGVSSTPARELATFPAQQKPEGVTIVSVAGKPRPLVVFDTGGYRVLD